MSFLPLSKKGGLLAGIYMVNCIVPTVLIVYQYAAANVAGHTKRAFSTVSVAFAFGVGNIIGPQTYVPISPWPIAAHDCNFPSREFASALLPAPPF